MPTGFEPLNAAVTGRFSSAVELSVLVSVRFATGVSVVVFRLKSVNGCERPARSSGHQQCEPGRLLGVVRGT
jgi:hypothetical protein